MGAALIASLAVACASPPTSSEAGGGVAVVGRVTATGSEPHVILVLVTDDGDYELVGDRAGELWRLQQRDVSVRGRVVRKAYGPGFPAQLEVDGFTLPTGRPFRAESASTEEESGAAPAASR